MDNNNPALSSTGVDLQRPRRIDAAELKDWFARAAWSVPEAILLLHGFSPNSGHYDSDTIRAMFPIATSCLPLAEDPPVSPAQWHEWMAKHKEISGSLTVLAMFVEWQYTGDQRIGYFNAKKVLSERWLCTAEEIAMWLFSSELVAWTGKDSESERFAWNWCPGEELDFLEILGLLHFSSSQIKEFRPLERWLTYQQLLDRWAESDSMDQADAERHIALSHKVGDLAACHPQAGMAAEEGEPALRVCCFRLSDIESIELEMDIGVSDRAADRLFEARTVGDSAPLLAPEPAKDEHPFVAEIRRAHKKLSLGGIKPLLADVVDACDPGFVRRGHDNEIRYLDRRGRWTVLSDERAENLYRPIKNSAPP